MRTETKIRKLLDSAHALAYMEVKCRAIAIMKKHKNISHFCMAMGTACFYENGKSIDSRHYTKSLIKFIDEFDSEIKLTGQPLRLERKGNNIEALTNW